ncbi:MAG TPA: subclass B3 metallo-beta-lactamase [Xanthomonadales bacterium]|nr:subclass B3 metallo-beta-lactamase [Xanthomonadales bacterium]
MKTPNALVLATAIIMVYPSQQIAAPSPETSGLIAGHTAESAATLVEDTPKDCAWCEAWNTPIAPFRVFGNTWYVGTAGLASLLISTDEGLILIDGALAQSAHLIAGNIREIGFDPLDVKYILNSHAHFDHAGGIAALQRFTDAQVLASTESVRVLESGEIAAADPQFNFGTEANRFPAVENVSLIGDEETLTLGDTTLTAFYTPGHTPGGTTWTWQSCEGSNCMNMVYADSLSPVSADGFLFSDAGLSPNNSQKIAASINLIRGLPCDVLLAPHPSLIKMEDKLNARSADADSNPFVNPGACEAYAEYFDEWLARRLAEEGQN